MRSCAHEPIHWCISQVLDSPNASVDDHFSCLEFDATGDLLAIGDRGGHVTVFRQSEQPQRNGSYHVYCTFTSHEPGFDYLKSLEIDEKITSIAWLPNVTSAHHLLSANDKTIKLWRISEQHQEAYNFNIRDEECASIWSSHSPDSTMYGPPIPTLRLSAELRVPRFRKSSQLLVESRLRRIYSDAHMYHINSISVNSDQETFLSADDLRVNLWHLEVSDQSFTIVDTKPSDLEDLAEVITCARFHPSQCYLFAYSTSRGAIRLCDMRARALCDNYVLALEDCTPDRSFDFFSDIVASLSDFRFAHSGHHVLTRDYLTLRVWDMRMGDRPCELYTIHEPLRSQLCILYENDSIFDKFLCSWSTDDRYIVTGSYGDLVRIIDRHTSSAWLYDLNDHILADTDAEYSQPVPLSPKLFVSPEESIGVSMGLTSICVASMGVLRSMSMGFATKTDAESAPQSRLNESTFAPKKLISSNLPAEKFMLVPEATDSPALDGLGESFEMSTTIFQSPSMGSKRRKTSNSSDHPNSDYYSSGHHEQKLQRRRRKQRLPKLEMSNRADVPITNEMVLGFQPVNDTTLASPKAQPSHNGYDFPSAINGESIPEKANLCELRPLDYQRRLLCVAWHPRSSRMCAVSACQLYVIEDTQPVSPNTVFGLRQQDSQSTISHSKASATHENHVSRSLPDYLMTTVSSNALETCASHLRRSRSA